MTIFNSIEENDTMYPESGWHLCCQKNETRNNIFLRVKPDFDTQIRLFGNPYKLVKIFTKDKRCINLKNEEIGRKLQQKYPDRFKDISVRTCCWCIDRQDNSLKILDMLMSVAKKMGNRQSLVGRMISGVEQGCDWKIITNGKQGKDVRYDPVYIEETPLTQEEQDMIKDSEIEMDLSKIFNPLSFEEAEKKLLESD